MADTDFFTTGYRYALPALQGGTRGRPAWDYKPPASIPIQFKAKDKSLMKSLKRDTTLRISTPRTASTRKYKTQTVDRREFPPLPPPKVAYRKIELSPETQAVIEDLNNMPSEIPTLKHIIYQLRNERLKATAETDYEYGQRVQRAFVATEKRLKWEIEHQSSYESLMKMVEQHHELETYVTGVLENFDNTFNEFMQVTEENLNKLYQQHEEELARFDEQEPQEPAARFRKRSPRLLAARDQERRYATHNKFVAAKKAQRQADAIEAVESSEAMRRTREDFLRRREQLIARQDATIEHFLQHAEETRLGIVNQRDRELSGYIRRLNALDRHIENGCAEKGVREEDVTDEDRISARVERVRSIPDGEHYPNTPGVTAFMRVRTPREPSRPKEGRPARRAPQPVEEEEKASLNEESFEEEEEAEVKSRVVFEDQNENGDEKAEEENENENENAEDEKEKSESENEKSESEKEKSEDEKEKSEAENEKSEEENEKSEEEKEKSEEENDKSDDEKVDDQNEKFESENEEKENENEKAEEENEKFESENENGEKQESQTYEEKENNEEEATHEEKEVDEENEEKKLTDESDSFDAESEGEKEVNNESFEDDKKSENEDENANESFEIDPAGNDSFEQEENANDSFEADERKEDEKNESFDNESFEKDDGEKDFESGGDENNDENNDDNDFMAPNYDDDFE